MKQSELFHPADRVLNEEPRRLRMLCALGTIGLNKELLAVLAEWSEVRLHGFASQTDAMRFLAGPVVVYRSPWQEDIPDWMPVQAIAERSEIVFGQSQYIVGPTEMAAVMYPRTMEAPMHGDLVDLYLWASVHACSRHYGRKLGEQWHAVREKPILDEEVCRPRGRLWFEYSSLAHEIRRQVISAQTVRERQEKRALDYARKTGKVKHEASKPTVVGVQLELL